MKIQQEFIESIVAANEKLIQRFGNRLLTFFISGSVANGEALPGISDVDSFAILLENPSALDEEWQLKEERRISDFYAIKDFHINLLSKAFLKNEQFLYKFIFRYNSIKCFGTDVLKEIENEGIKIPAPNSELAKSRLKWASKCYEGLRNNNLPEELFQGAIPTTLKESNSSDLYISRKLARNFILIEGGYFLMYKNAFKSFSINDVIAGLYHEKPYYSELLELSDTVLVNYKKAKCSPIDYRELLIPFVGEILSDIGKK